MIDLSVFKVQYTLESVAPGTDFAISFSPNGKLLAVAGLGEFSIYSATGFNLISHADVPYPSFKHVQFSPDSDHVVATCEDRLMVWFGKDMCQFNELQTSGLGAISAVAFCQNTRLITGGERGLLCVFNLAAKSCERIIQAHHAAINTLAVSPDRALVASGGSDGVLRIFTLPQLAHLRSINHDHPVKIATFANNVKLLVGIAGHPIVSYNVVSGDIGREFVTHKDPTDMVVFPLPKPPRVSALATKCLAIFDLHTYLYLTPHSQ